MAGQSDIYIGPPLTPLPSPPPTSEPPPSRPRHTLPMKATLLRLWQFQVKLGQKTATIQISRSILVNRLFSLLLFYLLVLFFHFLLFLLPLLFLLHLIIFPVHIFLYPAFIFPSSPFLLLYRIPALFPLRPKSGNLLQENCIF